MRCPDFKIASASMATVLLLAACSGGAGDAIPPFWMLSGLVVADIDGDGRVDVAVAATYVDGSPPHPGYVWIYRQTSPGTFDAPLQFSVGPDPWGLSAGDFDGDGRTDLVAATSATVAPQPNVIGNSGGISVLRQDPAQAGSFLASQWVPTGGAPTDAAISQLTNDNLADVIVADGVLVNGRALLLEQNPSIPGTLLAPVPLLAGSGKGSEDLAVADINGDGRSDLVLAAADAVAVFYQRAGGGFDPVVIVPAGLRVQGVAVADLDGDGRADIVVANAGNAPAGGTGGASVTVLRQTSPGGFVATNIPVADGARRVAIGDLNGDGVPDIAVVSLVYQAQQPSRVSVLLQSPVNRGQFAVIGVYDGPFSGNFIAIGDVNGDGSEDIVVNEGPSVLLQRAAAPGTFAPLRSLR
jgi:hypothetical protein